MESGVFRLLIMKQEWPLKKHGAARRYAGGIFLYQKILLENSNLAKIRSISFMETQERRWCRSVRFRS